ncbi:MAG: hypothetical protein MZW92_04245 [Comamonadaceae bacterium]|nr:hypothetical protein [Comamonadaceae bacterium]
MKEQVPAPDTDAQVDRRGRRRGRLEHRRRPGAVAADGPRGPGPQLHLPPGVRRRRRRSSSSSPTRR